MSTQRVIELLTRKAYGNISIAEQAELYSLIRENEECQEISENFELFVNEKIAYDKDAYEASMEKVYERMAPKIVATKRLFVPAFNKRSYYLKILKVAALFVLIAGGVWLAIKETPFSNSLKRNIETVTAKGSRTSLTLPDGSKVWMNADSKISYDKTFGRNTRNITLSGEAYFDVVRDEALPFIVHTNTVDIKVLGTTFNVRAYENEANSQTTLIRGKLELVLKKYEGQKIILNPNEKAIVQNAGQSRQFPIVKDSSNPSSIAFTKIELNKADSTASEIEWMKNKLVFRQEKFEDIIPVLERWYNVTIILKTVPKGRGFSGTFENDGLEDVLQTLKLTAGINYTILKDTVIIY